MRIAQDRVLVVEDERAPQAVAVNNQAGRDEQCRQAPRAACRRGGASALSAGPRSSPHRSRTPSIADRSSGAGCHNGSLAHRCMRCTRGRGWIEAEGAMKETKRGASHRAALAAGILLRIEPGAALIMEPRVRTEANARGSALCRVSEDRCRTEGAEAPVPQGARRENTGSI